MASFRSLTADRRPFDAFRARVQASTNLNGEKYSTPLSLHVFEWPDGSTHGEEISDINSVEELSAQSSGAVRVM